VTFRALCGQLARLSRALRVLCLDAQTGDTNGSIDVRISALGTARRVPPSGMWTAPCTVACGSSQESRSNLAGLGRPFLSQSAEPNGQLDAYPRQFRGAIPTMDTQPRRGRLRASRPNKTAPEPHRQFCWAEAPIPSTARACVVHSVLSIGVGGDDSAYGRQRWRRGQRR
jgi:hypothetical protein